MYTHLQRCYIHFMKITIFLLILLLEACSSEIDYRDIRYDSTYIREYKCCLECCDSTKYIEYSECLFVQNEGCKWVKITKETVNE